MTNYQLLINEKLSDYLDIDDEEVTLSEVAYICEALEAEEVEEE